MAWTRENCRCCHSTQDLELPCRNLLDVYKLFCNTRGLENEDTPNLICFRCLEFLTEVNHFRNNLNFKHINAELIFRSAIEEKSSQLEIKTEAIDVYNVIDEVDVQINKVEENVIEKPAQLDCIKVRKKRISRNSLTDCDGFIKCSECSYVTTFMKKFKEHVARKHSNERPFICDQCNYCAKMKKDLMGHKKRLHPENNDKPFKCSECSFETTSRYKLKNHNARKHSDERPFICDQCNYRAKINKDLLKHRKIHLENIDKPFKCSECGYNTKTLTVLKMHIARNHSDEIQFSCDKCNYCSKSKFDLAKHRKIHRDNNEKPFTCSECSFKTASMIRLKFHIAQKHSVETLLSCDQCGYFTRIKKHLRIHIMRHMNDTYKHYKCSECSFKTIRLISLKYHVKRRHSDERPFCCEHCNYRGKFKSDITRHMMTHFSDPSQNIKCTECSYEATTLRYMRRHYARQHRDEKSFIYDRLQFSFQNETYDPLANSPEIKY